MTARQGRSAALIVLALAATGACRGNVGEPADAADGLSADQQAACTALAAHYLPRAESEARRTPVRMRGVANESDLPTNADIAAVDGTHLLAFGSAREGLRIFDTTKRRLTLLGSLVLPDEATGIVVLPGHRVLVTGEHVDYGQGFGNNREQAVLTVIDLANPRKPRVLHTERIDGTVLSSTVRAGVARVVLTSTAHLMDRNAHGDETDAEVLRRNTAAADAAKGSDYLPHRTVTDADGQVLADGPLLECADLARPADAHGLGITAVVTIDPAGSAPAPVQGVADQGIDVLDSGDRIYVTALDESVPHARDRGATTIYDLDPTGRYLAFGAVPGHVPGAEALSARNGVLRVALGMSRLSGVPRGEVIDRRGVATLREHGGSLQLLGSSIGAGHKDWIESLAWVGDNAVLEAPDGTRYVYDVADPAKPHLAAAVTLPGHIDFVASTTQQRTRVVGPDERHSGLDTPSAVGVLDLTDPTRPRMIHSTSLGKGRAEGGLQSFASLPDLHLLTVPLRTVKTVGPPQCPLLHGRPSCSTDIYSAALVRIGANDSTRVVGRINVGGYPRRFFAVRGLLVAVTDETVVLIDPVRARVLDTVHGDNHKS